MGVVVVVKVQVLADSSMSYAEKEVVGRFVAAVNTLVVDVVSWDGVEVELDVTEESQGC